MLSKVCWFGAGFILGLSINGPTREFLLDKIDTVKKDIVFFQNSKNDSKKDHKHRDSRD